MQKMEKDKSWPVAVWVPKDVTNQLVPLIRHIWADTVCRNRRDEALKTIRKL